MFRKSCLILLSLFSLTVCSQNIAGKWKGLLKVQKTSIPVIFKIKKTTMGYSTVMDSPSQNAFDIKVDSTIFKDSILQLSIGKVRIKYTGKLNNFEIFVGKFTQGNSSFSMNLKKFEDSKNNRPQEPKEPFDYIVENVSFKNEKANINLHGSLTLPKNKKNFPVVILVSGSGPQNRDEEAFGHKPFLVIADFLTKKGIGVLRYDDRGTAKSEGDFKTASLQDFKDDAVAAVNYIKNRKDFKADKIGIIGHSEGGTIAPMIANSSKDVNFLVLLAGTILQGNEILLIQQQIAGKEAGASDEILKKVKVMNSGAYEIILKNSNKELLKQELSRYIKNVMLKNSTNNDDSKLISKQVNRLTSPWMLSFLRYNPSDEYQKLEAPVFALFGKKDVQVTSKENVEALKKLKKKKIDYKVYDNLNHLFQECNTGSPNEYAKIEQTISQKVLVDILKFIKK